MLKVYSTTVCVMENHCKICTTHMPSFGEHMAIELICKHAVCINCIASQDPQNGEGQVMCP